MLFTKQLRGLVDDLGRHVREFASLAASLRSDLKAMQASFDEQIAALKADVANLATVDQSAIALITGLSGQLSAALSSAKAAGLTTDQAQQLDALDQALKAQATSLASAVTANTPTDPTAGVTPPAPEQQPA